mgnify:CR=1 FL=1
MAFCTGFSQDRIRKLYAAYFRRRDGQPATVPAAVGQPRAVSRTGAATRAPGLIHKYGGRALLIASGLCAVNCRYCFRRHFPYARQAPGADWRPVALVPIGHPAATPPQRTRLPLDQVTVWLEE